MEEKLKFELNNYKKVYVRSLEDGTPQYSYKPDGTKQEYTISRADGNNLEFTMNGKRKIVPIVECDGSYIYRIFKKRIAARDGIEGLWEFLTKEVARDVCGGWARYITEHVFEDMAIKCC